MKKEKTSLEEIIEGNKQLFDDKELPINHRSLFEAKLEGLDNNVVDAEKKGRNYTNWLNIAAIFIVGIAITSSMFYSGSENNTENLLSNNVEKSTLEINKMEVLYSSEIKEVLVPIRTEKKFVDPKLRAFLKQMDELDTQNQRLEELLVSKPGNEEILSSIIDNYKRQLKIMEELRSIIAKDNLKTKY